MAVDFQDLHAFVHAAQQESFSRAASQLRIAQSAVSRRVARLEHQLGLRLFTRYGRGIRLTEAGTVLMDRAGDLMRELDQIERDVLTLAREPVGHVRVAFPPTSGQVLAPILVEACRVALPRVTLHLREGFSGAIHEWIGRGEIDLALIYEPEPSADLEILPLIKEPLYLVAPSGPMRVEPTIPEIKSIKMRELARLPLILPSRSHGVRVLIERYAAEHAFRPTVVYEVDGMRTIKGLVEAGLGYTVFSYAGVYEEVTAGTLRAIGLDPGLNWTLAMVNRVQSRPSRALTEVRNLLKEQTQSLLERDYWQGQLIKHAPAATRL